MSTPTSGDLLLVNRGGVNYQIDYDDMSTLQDTDLLLVNRAGVNYQIPASDLDLGPDGLILPSVDVLTPINGAGLDEGSTYTPLSSAYVSTDTTPIYQRYFPELITTVSGGSWVDENKMFNGSQSYFSELTGAAGVVSQAVFTPQSGWVEAETTVWAYVTNGGTVEVLDDTDTVLRSYDLLTSFQEVGNPIGIVRADQKIRFSTNNQNESLFISRISGAPTDYIITGRVAFEFTDSTDLDKMVAPIIQVDENGDVKVPTTSTVDSTTTVPGVNKSLHVRWQADGTTKTFTAGSGTDNTPSGARMSFVKEDNTKPGLITDSALDGYLYTSNANGKSNYWSPLLDENQSDYRIYNSQYNNSGRYNYVTEIGVAPKVLDIVSYEGNSSNNREIPHNLGTKPGMIIVKCTNSSTNWMVFHINRTPGTVLNLDEQFSETSPHDAFPTEPTSKNFYVGTNGSINGSGFQYVAYVFAADTPGKVKCGSYDGSGSNTNINVGFQAGFVLIKRTNGSADWIATNEKASDQYKYWNPNREDNSFQGNSGDYIDFQATELYLRGGNTDFNASGGEYVYLAIASDLNGPDSTQLNLLGGQDLEFFTDGTQITSNLAASGSRESFSTVKWSGNSSTRNISPQISAVDYFDLSYNTGNKWMLWIKSHNNANGHNLYDSERGMKFISTQMTNVEMFDEYTFKGPVGTTAYKVGPNGYTNENGSQYISWNFLGSPQFFDVQKYVSTASTGAAIQHDLGVEPGLIIFKNLSTTSDWWVYHSELPTKYFKLNQDNAASNIGNWVTVTDTDFTINGSWDQVNGSINPNSYIAYLFAKDTPYVKCGKYTGAGAGTQLDVGFKPRWMMIKSLNSSRDWVIIDKNLDSNFIAANSYTSKQSFNFSFTSTGVTLTTSSPHFNTDGVEYVYIAIADESLGHPPSIPSSSTVQGTPDVNAATMVVNAESFDVGDTASAAALEASITSVAGSDGNTLLVDSSTGTWMPGLYAKGSETTVTAPSADEITFTSTNAGTTSFSGVDATLTSRTWTLESGPAATGPWTVVDTYVDYDALNSQDGATPWSSNKPALAADTFYRVKVSYDSNNAESVESVYSTFKTSA